MNMNIDLFLNENYIAFLILAGLVIVMYAYRDVHIPTGKSFILITSLLFVMCVAHSVESWASLSPNRLNARLISSVVHYIVQPLVLYLELAIIIPASERQNKLHFGLVSLPIVINTIIYLIAPFSGKLVFWYDADYSFNRGILGYSIYIVTFFYLILLAHCSYLYFKSHNNRMSIFMFFMVAVAVLTGLLEFLNIVPGYIDEAFAFGALIYYVYLVNLHDTEMQASLSKKELELSESKLSLLRQQIRPHFVFNSLHIIKSLIRTDQAKAIMAIEDFSDYLRANVNAIESDKLITFEEELSLVDSYVGLALADESKGITVEYDIKEQHFRLPPFTVEPMVENAIRHGLRNGGILTLSTRKEGDDIVITVSDNGLGFEETLKDKGKKRDGTGLGNVKARLAQQCNGIVDIKSSSEGTDVIIRIPQANSLGEMDDEGSR